jgi:hypothetical protein
MSRPHRSPGQVHKQPSAISLDNRPPSRSDAGSLPDVGLIGGNRQGLYTPPTDEETTSPAVPSRPISQTPISRFGNEATGVHSRNEPNSSFNPAVRRTSRSIYHNSDGHPHTPDASGREDSGLSSNPDVPPPRYSQDFSDSQPRLDQHIPQGPPPSTTGEYRVDIPQEAQILHEPHMAGASDDIEEEWDLILPLVQASANLAPSSGFGSNFNLRDLVGAVQCGATGETLQTYLANYEKQAISHIINDDIEGFPAMFYAIATNDESVIRLWVKYGGDPNVIHENSAVSLLAFTIMHSEVIRQDTTKAVVRIPLCFFFISCCILSLGFE